MTRAVRATLLALLVVVLAGLATGAFEAITIRGTSMYPTLRDGDLVLARADGGADVGDVVAFRSDTFDQIVVHRVTRIDREGLTTAGDGNAWTDTDRVMPDQLIGRVLFKVPWGGRVTGALRTPTGLALLGALFGATLARRRDAADEVGV